MKAISLWQPWASLWASGRKRFETRHWQTGYRGPLAIHAAKKLIADPGADLEAILIAAFGGQWARDLPRGCLLASGRLIATYQTQSLVGQLSDEELAQGDFHAGRFAWKIVELTLLVRPLPWRGQPGLFEIPDDIVVEARARIDGDAPLFAEAAL